MSITTFKLQQADDTFKIVQVSTGAPSGGTSSPDLDAIAALDATQSGVIASDGSGWIRKTYSSLKTALAITKTDLGVSNVDNTSDALKPISNATQTALNGKQPINPNLTSLAGVDSTTAGAIANDGAGWIKKTYAQLKTALVLVKADVGLANVDNTSDVNKPVSTAQTTAINSAGISHVNQYHPFDFRRYGAVGDGSTDNTTAFQTAIADIAAVLTPGVKFQNSSGTAQAGAQANGGGALHIPPGTFVVGNVVPEHRMRIEGEGWGSILLRKAATSGAWIQNRRDSTKHAGYVQIANLTLDGNRANQSSTGDAVVFNGDTTYTYTDTKDEDFDVHNKVTGCQIIQVKGNAVHMIGSGENSVSDCDMRDIDAVGIWAEGFDNRIINNTIGWTGLQGILVDGDSVKVNANKCWYSGRVTAASGQGIKITSDSGSGAGNETQDTAAQGVLFDNAFGWTFSVTVDSASASSAGAYAGVDIFASQYVNIRATVRNRYRSDGTFGPCKDGLNHSGGSTLNFGEIVAAQGVWGTQNTLRTGSVTNASKIRLNGTLI